ncbi:MAG: hypothetical protein KC619_09290 [Myxococcales bacterium]|nr:hypothetical protein [Myxococcales bacterium]
MSHDPSAAGVADLGDDPFVLVVSPRSPEDLEQLGAEMEAFGRPAYIVRQGADAQILVENCGVLGVLIDPELLDMSPYDLCGWIRARFRDLPVMIMETPPEVDTAAVHLCPGGGIWTISESLRARMTDLSVLHGVLGSIPGPDVEHVASQTGQTMEETEEALREVLEKFGFETHQELRFHLRNLPRDYIEREDDGEVIVRFEPGPIPTA